MNNKTSAFVLARRLGRCVAQQVGGATKGKVTPGGIGRHHNWPHVRAPRGGHRLPGVRVDVDRTSCRHVRRRTDPNYHLTARQNRSWFATHERFWTHCHTSYVWFNYLLCSVLSTGWTTFKHKIRFPVGFQAKVAAQTGEMMGSVSHLDPFRKSFENTSKLCQSTECSIVTYSRMSGHELNARPRG